MVGEGEQGMGGLRLKLRISRPAHGLETAHSDSPKESLSKAAESLRLAEFRENVLGLSEPDDRTPFNYTLEGTPAADVVALYIATLAKGLGVDASHMRPIAGAVQMLLVISLMVDDMEDKDAERNNKDAAWVTYGTQRTNTSIQAVYDAVLTKLGELNPKVRDICDEECRAALASLQHQKTFSLDSTTLEEIMADWDRRQLFYHSFPFRAFAELNPGIDQQKINAAHEATRLLMRVLQFANDWSDITRDRLKDIENGLVTAPIKLLYEELGTEDRAALQALLDAHAAPTDEQKTWVKDKLKETGVVAEVKNRIDGLLADHLSQQSKVTDDNRITMLLLKMFSGQKTSSDV